MYCHAVATVFSRFPPGQELDLKVVSVDTLRCRVALSLKQMQSDPLQETMDSIQWRESEQAVPEIQQVIQVLQLTTGIEKVAVGRQAEVANTVAQVRASELLLGLFPIFLRWRPAWFPVPPYRRSAHVSA